MKIRYCQTILHTWKPCPIGWGSMDSGGYKDCYNEPLEENCRYVVNTEDVLICPTCGTALGIIGGPEDGI